MSDYCGYDQCPVSECSHTSLHEDHAAQAAQIAALEAEVERLQGEPCTHGDGAHCREIQAALAPFLALARAAQEVCQQAMDFYGGPTNFKPLNDALAHPAIHRAVTEGG